MTLANKIATILVAIALALGGLATWYVGYGAQTANTICDARSLRTMSTDAELTGDQLKADLLRQWAEKCEALQTGGSSLAASASPSPAPSQTANGKPTNPDKARGIEEFLANRPAKTKTSTNAFGPKNAVLPSLGDKKMEKLTAEEAKAELIYVTEKVDRMQTADKALDLGIVAKNGDKNQVNDLTKRFVKDRRYWEEIRKKVADRIRELKPSIVTEKARTVVGMSYSTPGKIPQVGTTRVSFGYATKWLVLKDESGKVVAKYRLACHFQHGGGYMRPMPEAPKGATITPEGETNILVNACRLVGGKWVNVHGVEHKQGDLPVNDAKCKPTSPTPSTSTTPPVTPTPTPSETPSTTPTPTPTPSNTPTPTPSCREKECETAPTPTASRDKPTATPTRSPENTPSARPSQPATTATPTVKAPGATKTPKPTASVPQAPQPSPTATGSIKAPD